MKIHCEWLVLAERVIEDTVSHNLTLVSCLDRIQSLSFPSQHHGFAAAAMFRSEDGAPGRPVRVKFRLVRLSEVDPDEVVSEVDSEWAADLSAARWVANYQFVRLKRPETLGFRVDHKVGRAAWQLGPTRRVEIARLELPPEELRRIVDELRARGLPTDGLDP